MGKAWSAGDDTLRAVEDGIMDGSVVCKAWSTGDDAARAVKDGSGMCNTGSACGDASHAVRSSFVHHAWTAACPWCKASRTARTRRSVLPVIG